MGPRPGQMSRHTVRMATWAPAELDEIERSADPAAATALLARVGAEENGAAERIAADPVLRAALIAVSGASPWLSRLCLTDSSAIDVLANLDCPVELASLAGEDGGHLVRGFLSGCHVIALGNV